MHGRDFEDKIKQLLLLFHFHGKPRFPLFQFGVPPLSILLTLFNKNVFRLENDNILKRDINLFVLKWRIKLSYVYLCSLCDTISSWEIWNIISASILWKLTNDRNFKLHWMIGPRRLIWSSILFASVHCVCVVLFSDTSNFVSKSSVTGEYLFLYATNSFTKIFRIVYKLLWTYMKV